MTNEIEKTGRRKKSTVKRPFKIKKKTLNTFENYENPPHNQPKWPENFVHSAFTFAAKGRFTVKVVHIQGVKKMKEYILKH